MRFYKNEEERCFFEEKRFCDSKLPTYDDIKFLLKDILGQNISSTEFNNYKDKTISAEIWNRIKPIIYFQDKNASLKNMKNEVFSKNNNYNLLLDNNEIFTFEKFLYEKDKSLNEALKDVNIENYSSMYEYFARGENIGTCGISSRLIGVMFNNVKSCVGKIKSFEGTEKSIDGNHAWIEVNHKGKNYIIDTSLLLVIPIENAKQLDYIPQKEYDIKDLIDENNYFGDILYQQYNESIKYSTKNKASYEHYCDYREKINTKDKKMSER